MSETLDSVGTHDQDLFETPGQNFTSSEASNSKYDIESEPTIDNICDCKFILSHFHSFVFTCAENLVDEYTQSLKKSEQLKDAAPSYPEEREESNTVEPEQELLEDDDSPAAEERNPIPEYQNFTPEDNSAAEIAQNYQGETEVN